MQHNISLCVKTIYDKEDPENIIYIEFDENEIQKYYDILFDIIPGSIDICMKNMNTFYREISNAYINSKGLIDTLQQTTDFNSFNEESLDEITKTFGNDFTKKFIAIRDDLSKAKFRKDYVNIFFDDDNFEETMDISLESKGEDTSMYEILVLLFAILGSLRTTSLYWNMYMVAFRGTNQLMAITIFRSKFYEYYTEYILHKENTTGDMNDKLFNKICEYNINMLQDILLGKNYVKVKRLNSLHNYKLRQIEYMTKNDEEYYEAIEDSEDFKIEEHYAPIDLYFLKDKRMN